MISKSSQAEPSSAESQPPAHASAHDLFRRAVALMRAGEIDAWLGLCHDDVVMEFPFAPPPSPRRIDGKEALRTHLKGRAARRLSAPQVENVVVHECRDPATLIAEMTIHGEGGPDRPVIVVVQVRDGLLSLYRDYYNPTDLGPSTSASDKAA